VQDGSDRRLAVPARTRRAIFEVLAVAGLAFLVVGCGGSAARRTFPTISTPSSSQSSCGVGGNSAIQQLLSSRHITVTVDGQTLDIRTVGFQVCAAAQRDLMTAQLSPAAREALSEAAKTRCQPVPSTGVPPVGTSPAYQPATASSPLTSIYVAPQGPSPTAPSIPPSTASVTPTTWVNPPAPAVTTATTVEIHSGIAEAVLDEVLYRDALTQGKGLTIAEAQAAAAQGGMTGDPQSIQHALTVSKMLNQLVGSAKCQAAGARVHDYLLEALRGHHVTVSGTTGWTRDTVISGIANTSAAAAASPDI